MCAAKEIKDGGNLLIAGDFNENIDRI